MGAAGDAPVIEASRSIEMDAAVDTVWRSLTTVADWPRWHPYLRDATLDGGFRAGSAIRYGGALKHRLTVAEVVPGERVTLRGSLAIYWATTRWDVRAVTAGRTHVTFTESSGGPLIGLLYGSRRLGAHLDRWLTALRAEAEHR